MPNGWCARPFWSWRDWGTSSLAGEDRPPRFVFFSLIPPDDDIHQITTTSDVTSVSLHLLTNDTGCIWRHQYDAETGASAPFRSGYVNVECPPDEHDHEHDHTHDHHHSPAH